MSRSDRITERPIPLKTFGCEGTPGAIVALAGIVGFSSKARAILSAQQPIPVSPACNGFMRFPIQGADNWDRSAFGHDQESRGVFIATIGTP